ncbi:hypothetical protein CAI21_06230 [Alkalilimnicola ehrlichii]|uniref:SAM-dependent chlorinase/fluorinase n=1 Tax=Alkalilimnicola ehrlichii TaxID=351052 RepID=A0A3E0X065_9GAMM|nr:SAM-dependent chlorinase/fluorinase [Alkalilimnicola ehrlichii]RFA30218.1 hypothetical protein CAI21_06230 [Alkalilimnicola ehrlichii]RFA37803.1 hypothetical protein CAL65_07595 [Alkalilimnicola ehrlichii]
MFVLFTDFGWEGPYIGQMKALLSASSAAPIVDLMHDAPMFDALHSGYLLKAYSAALPQRAIVIAVVDPGVGGARKALAVMADGRWYLGPDNGLLAPIIKGAEHVRILELDVPEGASDSFHGRDLFCPAAVAIANGVQPQGAECAAGQLVGIGWPSVCFEICYVDKFGNAITGIPSHAVAADGLLWVGKRLLRYARTFCEVQKGEAFWYHNSSGLVEVAVAEGSAAETLGLEIGSRVDMVRR